MFYSGCAMHTDTGSPSQNSSLNAVSPAGTSKGGYLQQRYDSWEKEEWEPNTAADSENTAKVETSAKEQESTEEKDSAAVSEITAAPATRTDESPDTNETNASETFKLQTYIDKWGRYLENTEKNETGPSNVEKLDAMPAIGK